MAKADKYAEWIVANPDKKGTPEFETVAAAYKQARQEDSSLGQKAFNVAAEGAAAVNRGVTQAVDFATTDQVNNVLQLLGKERSVPTLTGALSPATQGGFMPEGTGRDVVRAAGEVIPAAVLTGSALRNTAQNLPQVLSGVESAGANAIRQMGSATVKQDVIGGAASGAGSEIGRQTSGENGALVGAIAAPAAVLAGPAAVSQVVKGIFRGGASRQAVARVVDDFAEADATPTVGQATGNRFNQGLENLSSKLIGGSPFRKSVENTITKVQARLGTIADGVSPKTGSEIAGRTIRQGIVGDDGFISRFQAKSGELWGTLDDAIGANSIVATDNTKAALGDMVRSDAFEQILGSAKLRQLNEVLTSADQVDYETLKAVRSWVGEGLSSTDLISDASRSQLKRLYAGLSQDIEVAANNAGAASQFSRANNYTRSGHTRIDDFVERITKKVDPDDVFKMVTRGSDSAVMINAIKRSLTPKEWNVVSANVIRRLGRSEDGQQDNMGGLFSLAKFLTDWNKLGTAKNALFSGSDELQAYRRNLDQIARVANTVKFSAKEMANPSGSATAAANIGAAGGLGTAVVTNNMPAAATIFSAMALNSGYANLMSNPRFVQWLASASRANAEALPAHIARLAAVANISNDADAQAIESLLTDLAPLDEANP